MVGMVLREGTVGWKSQDEVLKLLHAVRHIARRTNHVANLQYTVSMKEGLAGGEKRPEPIWGPGLG